MDGKDKTDEAISFDAVCIGPRLCQDNKMGQGWSRLLPDGAFGESIMLDKGITGARPGQVYRMQEAADGSGYYVRGARAPQFLRLWHDAEQRAAWQASSDSAVAKQRAAQAARKAAGDDPLEEMMAPLVRAYLKTDSVGRRIFIGRVIERLVRASIVGK